MSSIPTHDLAITLQSLSFATRIGVILHGTPIANIPNHSFNYNQRYSHNCDYILQLVRRIR
jgi:hypothetical protein